MKTFVLVCYEFVTLVTSVILAHIIDNTHRRTYVGTCIRAALSLRTIAGLTKDECRYTLSKDFWMYYVYFSLHLAFLFHGLILTYSYAAQTSIFMLDCSYYHLFFCGILSRAQVWLEKSWEQQNLAYFEEAFHYACRSNIRLHYFHFDIIMLEQFCISIHIE